MYDWIAEHCTYLAISIAHIARHFGVSVRKVYRRSSKVPQEATSKSWLQLNMYDAYEGQTGNNKAI